MANHSLNLILFFLLQISLSISLSRLDVRCPFLCLCWKGRWGHYGSKFYDDISSPWVTSPPWNGEQCIFEWQHKTSRPALKLNISFDCTFSTLHCDVPNLAETFKLLFIQKLLPKCQSPEMEQILHSCCSKVRLVTKYCKFNWQLFLAKNMTDLLAVSGRNHLQVEMVFALQFHVKHLNLTLSLEPSKYFHFPFLNRLGIWFVRNSFIDVSIVQTSPELQRFQILQL